MRPLTVLENLGILKDVVASSSLYIALIVVGCLIIGFISTTTKMNVKYKRRIYFIVYLAVIVSLIGIFYKDLSTMFDYLVNNLFVVFCFPNLAAYLAAIVFTNVILWTTTLNGKENRTIKFINSTVFVALHYLLLLLLMIVKDKKLDIFSQQSVYGNEQVVALINLSSIIFITWIVFLVIYTVVRAFIYSRKGVSLNQVVVYANAPVENKGIKEVVNIKEAPAFVTIPYKEKPPITPVIEEKTQPIVIPLEPITPTVETIITEVPQVEPATTVETVKPVEAVEPVKPAKTKEMLAYEETLTLEDYKLLLNLLKAEKEKKKEQIRDVVIEEETPVEKPKKETPNIQPKLVELQDLYKSII